jgi:hypothetical protein
MNSKFLLGLVSLTALNLGCGQGPLSNGNSATQMDLSSTEENILVNPYALLSGEQILRGMLSMTGTSMTNTIRNEYNARSALLASGYDLKLVTSPMMIGITNLATQVCNETVNRERAMQSGQRKIFRDIDFTRGPAMVSAEAYQSSLKAMALNFWGREISEHEMQILNDGRVEFETAVPANLATNGAQTNNLMMFTCAGMLASFDAVTM